MKKGAREKHISQWLKGSTNFGWNETPKLCAFIREKGRTFSFGTNIKFLINKNRENMVSK